MMMVKVFCVVLCFMFVNSVSIIGQCVKKNTAFKAGESLYYDVQYSCGPLWTNAGQVQFKAQLKPFKGKTVYAFDVVGQSLPSYDWMFKVRDFFQAYADTATLTPIFSERRTYEGGKWSHDTYNFDLKRRKVYTRIENTSTTLRYDTIAFAPCANDIVTVVYAARNLSFENRKIGEQIPVNIYISNALYPLYIRYAGKEVVTLRNGQSYKCIKFTARLVEGTIFRGGEDLVGYLSDDDNHIAILVEAKILIGTVKAVFNHADGLRNSFNAKIVK